MRAPPDVSARLARVRWLVGGAVGIVVRIALAIVVLEGTASLIGVVLSLPEAGSASDRDPVHMRYDPELGWAHVPDTHLVDFYGPGRDLTIDARGFRANRGGADAAPFERRLRAVCAGDAYTLGAGVDDADTWCARLDALEPRLETVNMGQSGYGVDQIYLWLRRDAEALDPRLWIVALTREDFGRMESAKFQHYGKPMLRIASDGALETLNVPVPHSEAEQSWLARNRHLIESLRIVQLAEPARQALFPESRERLPAGDLAALSLRVFEELQRLAKQRDAKLVLVYLPTRDDEDASGDVWRRRIARAARQREIAFVDLVEEQRALPPKAVEALYIPRGAFEFPGADGHFNEAGNDWVARTLRERLLLIPDLADLAAVLEPPASS